MAGVEAGFTFLLFAQGRGVAKDVERREWSLQKPQAPASLIQAPLFWDQLPPLSLCKGEREDCRKGKQ